MFQSVKKLFYGSVLIAAALFFVGCANPAGEGGEDANRAQTPVAVPGAGQVGAGATVALSTATADAAIYYTTDGSAPDTTKTKYTGPIRVDSALTIKAIAAREDLEDSAVLEAAYAIDQTKAAAPAASPAGGTVRPGAAVTLTTATEGAEIRYTTDGSAPTKDSALYRDPIVISAAVTIKAVALGEGL
ncbi:MAG: chitobiase/beta-hexosaminidase C-terminal domain-containing protein, partial [Treponema sp.]|nr:chitobiase/beta-hexosaminidase C-terminal domain-containing protein [Treponema sp.]